MSKGETSPLSHAEGLESEPDWCLGTVIREKLPLLLRWAHIRDREGTTFWLIQDGLPGSYTVAVFPEKGEKEPPFRGVEESQVLALPFNPFEVVGSILSWINVERSEDRSFYVKMAKRILHSVGDQQANELHIVGEDNVLVCGANRVCKLYLNLVFKLGELLGSAGTIDQEAAEEANRRILEWAAELNAYLPYFEEWLQRELGRDKVELSRVVRFVKEMIVEYMLSEKENKRSAHVLLEGEV